ncbi:MAG: hypothetical protein ACOVP4_12120 [Bacteriovoracaceae bacterium]
MKKQLVLGLGLAVLAAPAFASKARLQALGENTDGSFYINDNRNVFLNSAQVNNHKDLVTMEWGTGGNTEGADNAPNAEGGAFKTYNNMVYGVQLGRALSFNTSADGLGVAAFEASNAVDVFVGGDAGFKWGANLTYAASNDKAPGTKKAEAQVLDLNLGAIFGDFTAYVNYGAMGSTEDKLGTAYDIERSNAIEVGGTYQLNDYTIFGQYSMVDFEDKKSKKETEASSYLVGAGRNDKLNDKTTLFTKIQYSQNNSSDNKTKTTDLEVTTVPVVIGLEHDATSWLTVRGSVSQNLWSKSDDSKKKEEKTVANSTNVNAGATLKFGELSFDGVIGTDSNTTAGVDDTNNEKGILSTDNLMTRVSMTYKF